MNRTIRCGQHTTTILVHLIVRPFSFPFVTRCKRARPISTSHSVEKVAAIHITIRILVCSESKRNEQFGKIVTMKSNVVTYVGLS